ncbi:hypothetical protein J3R73_000195 [Labrys monachus]|uniref:Uncharacterized protein n=1 Tax=Labrys monachus TaxID=217067 RepID=A0ABU0F709_9HYPH|nr:hypothetical protein [Labrys monachus]
MALDVLVDALFRLVGSREEKTWVIISMESE